ncbi:hypothetical protein AURDEDRAFT_179606 [Auricularia subglabra TFB-10046 SS5]|nr:hypothetical protein AURDEDRAFT_179606 [Auricularia subglabra TFB-10046 SS5]
MRQIPADPTSNGRHPAQPPLSPDAPPPADTMQREIQGVMVTTTEEDDAGAGHRAARADRAFQAPSRTYREHSTSRTRATREAALREASEVHMALLNDARATADRRSRKDSRAARDDALPDAITRPPRVHGDYERERERDRAPMPGPRQQPGGQSWLPSLFSNARDTSQAEIMQLRKLLHEKDARETELQTRLAETERRLIVVTRDLEESRSFVAKEDLDAKELIVAFHDINEAVDDLAYLMSEAFPKDDLEAKLTNEGLSRAISDDAYVGKLFNNVLRVLWTQGGSLEDVITWMIASLLHSLLFAKVFRPWSPGLEDGKSDVIKHLYSYVCKREPQDRSARWRSMTYLDCHPERDDAALARSLNESFFRFFGAALRPLLPASSAFDFATLPPAFSNRVSKIVLDAIHFQDKAKGTYLSFDYEVYVLQQQYTYDRAVCEPADKPQRWGFTSHSEAIRPGEQRDVVLVGTSLGLRAAKGSADAQGTILRPTKTVVRGKALVGRCTFQLPPASDGDTPPPNHE